MQEEIEESQVEEESDGGLNIIEYKYELKRKRGGGGGECDTVQRIKVHQSQRKTQGKGGLQTSRKTIET